MTHIPTNVPSVESGGHQRGSTTEQRKACLAQILEAAQQLHTDAEWLETNVDGLLTDLKEIVGDRTYGTALAAAIDCVEWVNSAASNVKDELSTLINHLYDADVEPTAPHTVATE
jgi:hypothetical protein